MKRQIEARIAGIWRPTSSSQRPGMPDMLIENIGGLTDVFGKDAKAMTAGRREVLAEVSECVSKLHVDIEPAQQRSKSTRWTTSPSAR